MDRQERGTPPDHATPNHSWTTTIKSNGKKCPTIAKIARRKMPDEQELSRNQSKYVTDLDKVSVREQSSYHPTLQVIVCDCV